MNCMDVGCHTSLFSIVLLPLSRTTRARVEITFCHSVLCSPYASRVITRLRNVMYSLSSPARSPILIFAVKVNEIVIRQWQLCYRHAYSHRLSVRIQVTNHQHHCMDDRRWQCAILLLYAREWTVNVLGHGSLSHIH